MTTLYARLLALALLSAILGGCQSPGPAATPGSQPVTRPAGPPPPSGATLARFQRAYPELASGRFIILADFNSPDQAAYCRVVDAEGRPKAPPEISITLARNETGPGGLSSKLERKGDRVEFDLADAPDRPTLVRDWSPYAIFLASLFGPPQGAVIQLSISDDKNAWSRRFVARPGWNLLRVDLREIADTIDLRHIRSVAWSAPEISAPLEIALDDFVLADNTRWILGDPATPPERLYAFSRGRRLHVGTAGRFEIAFADGQIVWWQGPADGNLAPLHGLGPWPTPLPLDWTLRREKPPVYDDPANYENWGVPADATQEVVESTPLRVVIRGQWRYESAENRATPIAERPGHEWQYTVYADGRIYVRVRSEARSATWTQPLLGYALAVNQKGGFRRIRSEPAYAQREPVHFTLFSPQAPAAPDLLWIPHTPAQCAKQIELESADGRLAVTMGDLETAPTVESAHLIRIWPTDLNGAPDAETFAADYQYPAKIDIRKGRLRTDLPGDLNADGFNESEGLCEVAMADGLLRFEFTPGRWIRHAPAIRIHGLDGRECWVYCDGRILTPAGHDGAGNPVFTLPRSTGRPMMVDVNQRR
ncbi:MAG: hypothetical protein AMXMBFR47_40950 [Planctomycetota bacterium]